MSIAATGESTVHFRAFGGRLPPPIAAESQIENRKIPKERRNCMIVEIFEIVCRFEGLSNLQTTLKEKQFCKRIYMLVNVTQ